MKNMESMGDFIYRKYTNQIKETILLMYNLNKIPNHNNECRSCNTFFEL